jgi:hypothetical protein
MADVPAPSWTHQGWRLRLADGIVAAVLCAAGAYLGFWFAPFLIGIGAGILSGRRVRWAVIPAMVGAMAGWAIPLLVLALRDLPVGATARAVAALAGLPPYAPVAFAATVLLAALQVLAGAWLARAVMSLSAARRGGRPQPDGPQSEPDPQAEPDPQT